MSDQDTGRLAEFQVDESPPNPPRFDESVKLESRGTTQHPAPLTAEAKLQLHQALLWSANTIHKNSTAAKLRLAGMVTEAEKLEHCHTEYTIAVCQGCRAVSKFPNRCDLFFCAECQPRLSNDRRRAVEWWTREISQPKHVVLTVQNLPNITRHHVQEFRKWFTNLRRSKFARNWVGGFYSLEVTNEGRGWHLHLHALINAGWIDALALSEAWNKANNGLGRIVKVKDARQKNYLAEVTKYAVKGVQLAAWEPNLIAEFVQAFTGVRTFGVFGDLYGKRTEFAEWFRAVRDAKPACKCGCCNVHYFSEAEFLELDLVPSPQTGSRPPPVTFEHPELQLGIRPQQPR